MSNRIIGTNIAFIRKARGLSQSDLAHITDRTKACISKIEKGSGTTTRTLFAIASALGVEAQCLLAESVQVTTIIDYKEKQN